MDRLFVITENYPFGRGEEFFETEIHFLANRFDEITIFSLSNETTITRETPKNVVFNRIELYSGIRSYVKYLFRKDFYRELKCIRKYYHKKITFSMIKFLLWSLFRGDEIAAKISNITSRIPKADKVYLYSYWMHYGAYAIAKLNKSHRYKKAFCRAHGFDLYFERNAMEYIPLRHYILSNLDYIFPISLDGKKYLMNKFPQYESKMMVSKLGILGKQHEYMVYKIDSKKVKLLSISNFNEVKRIGLIVDALSLVKECYIDWIHIGAGGTSEKESKDYANTKLQRKKNIRFEFKGYLSNSGVMNFYRNNTIDLFINVSESEGIPVTMMEAQSFSIPIIATEVGGVSEIVNSGNGILLSPDPSPEQIARKIVEFSSLSSFEVGEMRKAAFESWDNYYNAEKNYTDFITKIMESS